MSEDYLSERNAKKVAFTHGLVAADWSADSATATAQSSTLQFAVTDVIVDIQTDVTADTSDNIQMRCAIYSNTNSADVVGLSGSLKGNCHFPLGSPILIPKSENYESRLQLGGATACTAAVYLLGYDCL